VGGWAMPGPNQHGKGKWGMAILLGGILFLQIQIKLWNAWTPLEEII